MEWNAVGVGMERVDEVPGGMRWMSYLPVLNRRKGGGGEKSRRGG